MAFLNLAGELRSRDIKNIQACFFEVRQHLGRVRADESPVPQVEKGDDLAPAVGPEDAAHSANKLEVVATGFLGGAALADALGVHASRRNAFSKKLERARKGLEEECWQEVANRRPNSPTFLYRADSPKIRELAANFQAPKPA